MIKGLFITTAIAIGMIGIANAGDFSRIHGPEPVYHGPQENRSAADNVSNITHKTHTKVSDNPLSPSQWNYLCVYKAATLEKVPLPVMYAIMKTEGGSIGTRHLNYDGSHDLGPMQINGRTWAGVLARLDLGQDNRKNRHIIRDLLTNNGCFNVFVGAWVLRGYYDEAGGSSVHQSPAAWAQAVGWYNSHDPIAMRAYQSRFRRNFIALLDAVRNAGLK